MSHIYGHVDTTNTNPPDWDNYRMMARQFNKNSSQLQQAQDSVGMDLPYGVLTIAIGNGDKKTRQLPFKNEDRIPLPRMNGVANIAYHIYLTKIDNDPYDNKKEKYRAYASDVIPLEYHDQAEELAVGLLGGTPGTDHIESYSPDDVEKVAANDEFNSKPHLRKVLLQTAAYMRTPSFTILYYGDKGELLSDEKRAERILKKVIFKIK